MNAIGECLAHCRAGVKSAQNNNGFDGGAGQFRGYVVGDARQADDLNLQHLSSGERALELGATDVLQTQRKGASGNRPLERVRVY
jgi:hypothetical protein